MKLLVTGGNGFIGSAVVRHCILERGWTVVNIDALTQVATLGSVEAVSKNQNYLFHHVNILDRAALDKIFELEKPDAIVHLAAESHVDRSIDGPMAFVQTNVVGTVNLLEAARHYFDALNEDQKKSFRFLHVSTDEVFGSLSFDGGMFTEASPYAPSSPYSASKAASDYLVVAFGHTYGLPVLLTNCSNNYGPYHFPEKLIPLMIIKAMRNQPLPVYGKGLNVRDWLFVEDHARALVRVLERAKPGSNYVIGGNAERSNIEVVHGICDLLDQKLGRSPASARYELVTHVYDRPGHDLRYAIDSARLQGELGWSAQVSFNEGLERTVDWYIANEAWWGPLIDCDTYSGERLGRKAK
jgi:dTDP-glucose 4,6-dehydratase